jgi:Na+-translocating ferredoxin:NAD+ oxidoreductase RnfD subunit
MTVPATVTSPRGVAIRGMHYPVVLPSVRDPRLHLAAVIISLQVLGQVAFDFRLSIAQILISVLTCAVLEVAIVLRRQRMLVWPASALLTGNGVAFILRVPGTEHGDWWSMNGWWIFAGTAAVSLLSKYLIRFRGAHIFNPSNFGLVLCFLLLGPDRADPLDFWWGPMSPALALALALIVVGGFAILSRLRLLTMALSFWLVFVTAVAVVAGTGHAMTARWHFGPVEGFHFWTILAFSPEILVFLFFMLTDPRTVPAGKRQRVVFGLSVAFLAALLVALSPTEFWAKVAVLAALAVVCAARPLAMILPSIRPGRRSVVALAAAGVVAYSGALVVAGTHTRWDAVAAQSAAQVTRLPRVDVSASKGVDATLDRRTAVRIAADLQKRRAGPRLRRVTVWLEAGARSDQFPVIVARLEGKSLKQTVEVMLSPSGYRIARIRG